MWVDLPGDKLRLPHVGVHRRTGRGRIALDGPTSCPAVNGGARVVCVCIRKRAPRQGQESRRWTSGCGMQLPHAPVRGRRSRAADREATTHDRSQACKPRDGGRRPLTCKAPGRTPPYTTPRGTHPRQPSRLVEPGACRPRARHSSRQPRPAVTGRGPPKVTPKGPSGECPRARHVLTLRSLRRLRRGPMWRIELTT